MTCFEMSTKLTNVIIDASTEYMNVTKHYFEDWSSDTKGEYQHIAQAKEKLDNALARRHRFDEYMKENKCHPSDESPEF